ncbi:MerC domain-containing protein [Neotamlana laminarinivorans]|uniref:MerC domain-containing protein n=1 Tax=Neotamlana laminarinivorans TaxID=2883124 RepID=A0A9X1HW95_9FLAO|nr:MerC domain-containing protein [Tamlana laminarinivorans]MCB4797344.1 MerC domain-containing protein [Tamlana laminarinivorans]
MNISIKKPDTLGALANSICLIHCIATPFLFMAQTTVAACCASEAVPTWWHTIDFIFIVISFFAVYRSTQTSSNNSIKNGLWVSWSLLFILIINEKIEWLAIPEMVMYIVAISLVILHLYNLNYCQCKTDKCCTKK